MSGDAGRSSQGDRMQPQPSREDWWRNQIDSLYNKTDEKIAYVQDLQRNGILNEKDSLRAAKDIKEAHAKKEAALEEEYQKRQSPKTDQSEASSSGS